VLRVQLNRTDIVSPMGIDLAGLMEGRTITAVDRRAKRIVFTIDDCDRFYIHLGMSGRLSLDPPDSERPLHTHLILDIGKHELRFRDPRRFGGIFWIGSAEANEKLGPEPLTLRTAHLAQRLARTTRAIKNALLDQNVIAGLGNIYVDESLFAARIHPLTPADKLTADQIARLNRSIKATLRRALRHRGSTLRDYADADGGKGAFQRLHKVYDRADLPCAKCKTPITRIVLGGRSTCFCGKCQPSLRRGAGREKAKGR